MSIELEISLNLSTRAFKALWEHDYDCRTRRICEYKTISSVKNAADFELLMLPNLGYKALKEIRDAIALYDNSQA